MEQSNIRHIPIDPAPPRPANDQAAGPLKFHVPQDVLDDADKRRAAGWNTACIDHARPTLFEPVMVTRKGDPFPRRATVLCAPPNGTKALIKYRYQDGKPNSPMVAWVSLTQLTFPNRNENCEVA